MKWRNPSITNKYLSIFLGKGMGVDVFFLFCFSFGLVLDVGESGSADLTTGNVMENQEDYFEWL